MQDRRLIGYDPQKEMTQAEFEAYLIRQVEPYIEDIREWMQDCSGWTFEIKLKKMPEAE
jgi:hypothetical protein